MKAHVGDRLVIRGHRIREPDRDAEILEVRGPNGGPPYRIRWSDDGHVTLLFPGVDARVEPVEHTHGVLPPGVLGSPARDEDGAPSLTVAEVVGLLRRHLDLEKVRTSDRDDELWQLWKEEVDRGDPETSNATVLDQVLARVRVGA